MSFALLLTALSDGKPRHVTELAQIAQTTPAQLNGLWQQAPQHLHGLLRQNDGYWKLAKSIALLPENTRHPLFDVQVQPETFAKPTPNTPTAELTTHSAVFPHNLVIYSPITP